MKREKILYGLRAVWGGSVVAQKYEVHQNAPVQKQNLKIFSPPRNNVSPGPPLWHSTSQCNSGPGPDLNQLRSGHV